MNTMRHLHPDGTLAGTPAEFHPDLHSGLIAVAAKHDVAPELAHLAFELACSTSVAPESEQRDLALLVLALMIEIGNGSTCIPLPGDANRSTLQSVTDAWVEVGEDTQSSGDNILASIVTLLENDSAAGVISTDGQDARALVLERQHLYTGQTLENERSVAQRLQSLLHESPVTDLEKTGGVLADVSSTPCISPQGGPIKMTSEQQYAVATALNRVLTVITGGPGTGKTTIVVSLLRCFVRLGVPATQLAVAAPTGRAAHRLAASIRGQLEGSKQKSADDALLLDELPSPQTLHRLLSYGARGFSRHRNDPLNASVVIIDEASMIDLVVMNHLLGALRPGTRIVLLGDADQLPSVGAGAILRDLVPEITSTKTLWRKHVPGKLDDDEVTSDDPRSIAAVRIRKNFRMNERSESGRRIQAVSDLIRRGEAGLFGVRDGDGSLLITPRQSPDQLEWTGVEYLETGGVSNFVESWIKNIGNEETTTEFTSRVFEWGNSGPGEDETEILARVLDHQSRFRLMALTRGFKHGVDGLNELFRKRWTGDGKPGTHRGGWVPGEPVLMAANDYVRGIFNGDPGVVIRIRRDNRITFAAAFLRGDELVATDLDTAGHRIEPAWVTTVHKAQGSEYDNTALFLPLEDNPRLSREIIYTAVTRARQSVVIIGPQSLLEKGVTRRLTRHCGIAERLKSVTNQQA